MLSTSHVRVRFVRNRVVPNYIDVTSDHWGDVAGRLLEVYRGREGATRGEIEEELAETIGDHPGQIVHQGLAKLLEDRCEFETVSGQPPEQLRDAVFRAATETRSTGTFDRSAVLQSVGESVGLTAEAVEQGLFADLKSEQRLMKFDDTTATRLLERYNVALAQAVLLRAAGVTVTVRHEPPARFRQLLRAIKFNQLICDVEQTGPGCCTLKLDGPLSLFSATTRYGLKLALFLPTLLHCRDFELRADVRWGSQRKEKLF